MVKVLCFHVGLLSNIMVLFFENISLLILEKLNVYESVCLMRNRVSLYNPVISPDGSGAFDPFDGMEYPLSLRNSKLVLTAWVVNRSKHLVIIHKTSIVLLELTTKNSSSLSDVLLVLKQVGVKDLNILRY